VHFVIVGKLEGAYGQLVRAASAGLGNVTLTGPVPDEDIPGLIHESFLNLNMSRSEALGLSQLEFMYNGVPVVTSGVGGQSWIVKDGSSGIVLEGPEDVRGAVKAITRLLDKPKKREKLGRKSREIASQYTMPKLVRNMAKALAKSLPETHGAPEGRHFEPAVEARVR
jgi:D-inositol-3-phosphate glycosyltransferase